MSKKDMSVADRIKAFKAELTEPLDAKIAELEAELKSLYKDRDTILAQLGGGKSSGGAGGPRGKRGEFKAQVDNIPDDEFLGAFKKEIKFGDVKSALGLTDDRTDVALRNRIGELVKAKKLKRSGEKAATTYVRA